MSELTAEEIVKQKWPDAVATFGTAGPFKEPHKTFSVLIWADGENGDVIGRGTCLGPGWEEAEVNAWRNAADHVTRDFVREKWPDAYAFLSAEWRGWVILPSQSSSATLRNLLSSSGGSESAAWADAAKRLTESHR